LSEPASPQREAIPARLTPDERRVILYRLIHVPELGRLDPNRIPPPPFSDAEMKRHGMKIAEKLMEIAWERIDAEED
jgi:hypothetical protein